jgi:predicted SAM-dependent methyltransferase
MAKKINTRKAAKAAKAKPELKIDLGCGKNKREGFIGVDARAFKDDKGKLLVDVVCDLSKKKWPWKDGSVDEAHCSHMLEHLTASERIHFINELYRVLKKGGKCQIITPHWCSSRAYGDLTHQWPPVSEFWYYYLSRDWRAGNAPHNDGYSCDFEAVWGYSIHPAVAQRSPEYQQNAVSYWKEAAQDLIANLTKK